MYYLYQSHDNLRNISGLRERTRFTWTPHVACIVSMKSRGGRSWKELGRTELIENSLDPEWSKTFLLDYYFEEKQVRKTIYNLFIFGYRLLYEHRK